MKNHYLIYKIVLTLFLIIGINKAFSQFRSDVPNQNIRETILGQSVPPSLFDAQNFQMHHSFSMSIMNMGGMSVGIGAYTNAFSLALSPNMSLNTQISIVQPTLSGLQYQGNLFYGIGLKYKASENSSFSFQINNYPTYYQRPNQHLHLRGY